MTNFSTCGVTNSNGWGYTYVGNLTGKNVIKYTYATGAQMGHFMLRIVFWMLLIDNWSQSDIISVTLNNNETKSLNSMSF